MYNWRAATDPGGYAAIFEVSASPLEHFWSLAIEEQFYLLVPVSVALTRRPAHVVAAMIVLGVGGVTLWWGSTDAWFGPAHDAVFRGGPQLMAPCWLVLPVRTLVEELDTTDGESGSSLIETAAELDASGYDGRYGRSDGSHIDFDRSEAFAAEVLGPALLSLKAER